MNILPETMVVFIDEVVRTNKMVIIMIQITSVNNRKEIMIVSVSSVIWAVY